MSQSLLSSEITIQVSRMIVCHFGVVQHRLVGYIKLRFSPMLHFLSVTAIEHTALGYIKLRFSPMLHFLSVTAIEHTAR